MDQPRRTGARTPASVEASFDGRITVVICTRRRLRLLERCLASLDRLDDADHEILVVDNDRVATAGALTGGAVRVVHEPRAGLAFARNRGIEESVGEVVAFIDDDCETDPGWLREMRIAFGDPQVGLVTGRVRAASTGRPAYRWFERLCGFDRGQRPKRFVVTDGTAVMPSHAGGLGTGCNMAFRREVFKRVGGFDEALDTPRVVRGGGDLDMFARVLEAGEVVEYVPSAEVHHHHRGSFVALAKQLFGYGAGLGALSVKYVLERRASWRAVWSFQRVTIAGLVQRALRRGGKRWVGLALVASEVLGDLVGPFAYVAIRARNGLRRRVSDTRSRRTRRRIGR